MVFARQSSTCNDDCKSAVCVWCWASMEKGNWAHVAPVPLISPQAAYLKAGCLLMLGLE